MAKKTENQRLGYVPTRKYKIDPYQDQIRELAEALPKGLFAIVCNENARYTAFHGACASLILPPGSRISFHTGCYVVDSCNRSFEGMNPDEDWICLMGDDHVFPPEFMLRLLAHMYDNDLDVIVPTCFKRSFPPDPVLYEYLDKGDGIDRWLSIDMNEYPKGGLIEVDAAGSAGMIVRKRVIDKMRKEGKTPFFELGGNSQAGEDLWFCKKVRDLGFKIHADLDSSLGHILNAALWPVRHKEAGVWGCQYDFNTQGGFVLELGKEKPA
jgi:hypothetical protein